MGFQKGNSVEQEDSFRKKGPGAQWLPAPHRSHLKLMLSAEFLKGIRGFFVLPQTDGGPHPRNEDCRLPYKECELSSFTRVRFDDC